MTTDTFIAKLLLKLEAVNLRPDEPFRYTSGILSPIYTDNRVLISYPEERSQIVKALQEIIQVNYPAVELVAGTSTAGIPWAAWLASALDIPMVYVRDKAKSHGRQNQVEGVLKPGQQTIIVDDLISTGGSALGSVEAIRTAGAEPLAVVALFTYNMAKAVAAFEQAKVPLHALTNFRTLVDTAVQDGLLSEDSQAKVLEWAADPAGWGKKMGLE